jgi:hypothetical protein
MRKPLAAFLAGCLVGAAPPTVALAVVIASAWEAERVAQRMCDEANRALLEAGRQEAEARRAEAEARRANGQALRPAADK